MNTHLMAIATGCAVVGGQLFAPVQGATRQESMFFNTAQACQLSIPTIDSKVRPRATSYNNEGTTNAFVICGYAHPAIASGGLIDLDLAVRSLDGVARNLTCTAVNGYAGITAQTYVSKTVTVPSTGFALFDLNPSDFGGTTEILDSGAMSVTCILPPNVGFTVATVTYNIEIGD